MSDASSNTNQTAVHTKSNPHSQSLVPWSTWVAVAFLVIVYFLAQAIGAIVVTVWPVLHHWSAARTDAWLSNSIYAQFFFVLIAELLVVIAVYRFLKLYGRDWRAIGFRRPKWKDLGLGLAVVPLYYLSYLVIIQAAGVLVPSIDLEQSQQLGFAPVGAWQLVLTFLSLVVIPPLVEETLMRGFLYTSLRKAMPMIGAALTTSALFAAAHLQAGSGAPLLWVAAIDTFVLSLFLVWLREKSGSLWAGMALHMFKNLFAFVSLFIFHLS